MSDSTRSKRGAGMGAVLVDRFSVDPLTPASKSTREPENEAATVRAQPPVLHSPERLNLLGGNKYPPPPGMQCGPEVMRLMRATSRFLLAINASALPVSRDGRGGSHPPANAGWAYEAGAAVAPEFKNLPPIDNVGNVDVYQLAKKQLHERYGRKINVVLERYKFYSRSPHDEESIDQFVAALRGLAVTCNFEQMYYNQVLRDQILMKTKSLKIQEKLWSCGSDLSLKSAIDVARTMEVSEKCIQAVRKNMSDSELGVAAVSAVTKDSKGVEKKIEWKRGVTEYCTDVVLPTT
ncbi:hypothetical protein NDU88_004661 [Pleurodeles waltl]|uniref:Uncharacterized protein n=1 Tax=Pleurodeles waltl TaxID=8319 RepID=A0AAV7L2J9_PLEWA|nr:hypothetical protein NDU88_004661 [Pleurodeles waltl]